MKQINFTNLEISDFCRQLALLLRAGVSLSDGLLLLTEEETDSSRIHLLHDLANQMDCGTYFYRALESAGCFPTHMTALLKVGEEVGRLEETLFSLARYYEDRDSMQNYLKNAITYPAILFVMMISVIVVLLSRVLPVFEDVYSSLGGSLTGFAGGLLTLGNFLNKTMPLLFLFLILICLFILLLVFLPSFRDRLISFWQIHQGDKGVSRKINDAHFAQALSMALGSGMPLEDGVVLARSILQECPGAAARCDACLARLESGEDLSAALKASQMLPASSCRMLALGIRAGNGDQVMEEIAHRLSEESRTALQSRIAMIEPALVIVTSLLVGIILFSVMLPLMNIMKTIG